MEIYILGGLANEKESIEMHKNLLAGFLRHGKDGGGGGACANTVTSPAAQTKACEQKFRQ
jgi:hypothetical protein